MLIVSEAVSKENTYFIFRGNGEQVEVDVTGGMIKPKGFAKLNIDEINYFRSILEKKK